MQKNSLLKRNVVNGKQVFPGNLPISNFLGLVSTPMTRDAPAALHPKATAKPTAPRPQIAHMEPGSTFAVFKAAPYPVDTPQPRRHALSKAAFSSI